MRLLVTLLRNLVRHDAVERDLDDEVQTHIELLADEYRAAGMDDRAARRAAQLELGGVEQVKHAVRDVRRGVWLEQVCQDVRHAVQAFRRSPGFAATAVVSLATGIAAATALFSVVTDPSWLAGVFLLGPAVGLSSVVAGVIVSARVNDPRVAQQVGGVVIVPVIALVLLQATGTLLVGPVGYTLLAIIVLAISLVGLRIGVRLFDREAILTRWR